jgi:hypothetical protein
MRQDFKACYQLGKARGRQVAVKYSVSAKWWFLAEYDRVHATARWHQGCGLFVQNVGDQA